MKVCHLFGLVVCVALLVTGASPALAEGPGDAGDLAAQGIVFTQAASEPWYRGRVAYDDASDLGGMPSIAVNPANGDTWAAFLDDTNDDLVVAHWVGSSGNCGSNNEWLCITVDGTGQVGFYPSIAINPVNGRPGVAYYDLGNKQLKYAVYTCLDPFCLWQRVVVDDRGTDDGEYADLVYDASGKPHISYHSEWTWMLDFNGLSYARPVDSGGNCGADAAAGKWQCDHVASTSGGVTGEYSSIDLNATGQPRVAYYDDVAGNLAYAWYVGAGGNCNGGATWRCATIDASPNDVGKFASLDYTSGTPEVAYYDVTDGTLKYTTYTGGTTGNCGPAGDWKCDVIDDIGMAPMVGLSLAVEGDGSTAYPHTAVIAYYDSTLDAGVGGLKVARPGWFGNCGPMFTLWGGASWHTWQCNVIDNGITNPEGETNVPGPHYVGVGIGLGVNSTGLATVAYYDMDAGDLLLAYQRYAQYLPQQLHGVSAP